MKLSNDDDNAVKWRENVEALLSDGDADVIRCREGGGPESLIGSLVLTVMRTRNSRDAALRASSGVEREPVAWQGVTRSGEVLMTRSKAVAEGWGDEVIVRPLYASPLHTIEVTGALIDAGAHALEHGTDLSLSWEEFCSVSELVLRSALSQNKGEE